MARRRNSAPDLPPYRLMAPGDLKPYGNNPRTHPPEQIAAIVRSIREFGFTVPVLIGSDGGIIAGHGRALAAIQMGLDEIPVIELAHLTAAQRRAYILADNALAQQSGWDEGLLKLELGDLKLEGFDMSLLGFSDLQLTGFLANKTDGRTDPDDIPEAPVIPTTRVGDIWVMGKHRLLCGDSTQGLSVDRLFAGMKPDCVLTDPPYCSGGFQEAGRASGSIGSDGAKHHKGGKFAGGIANDKLSTRGYIALMKSVLGLCQAPMIYAFTDWRMWINLYDVAESSGFGVRNMIVWDKGTPGMGRGWRTQHELVLFAANATVNFDNHKAQGNVIASKRTGNLLHPTQKPVDLLVPILNVTDMAAIIYDPFCGSGTTLIAAETLGRQAFLIELMPMFSDVAILRWQEFTGGVAVLEATGQTFDEVAAARSRAAAE